MAYMTLFQFLMPTNSFVDDSGAIHYWLLWVMWPELIDINGATFDLKATAYIFSK